MHAQTSSPPSSTHTSADPQVGKHTALPVVVPLLVDAPPVVPPPEAVPVEDPPAAPVLVTEPPGARRRGRPAAGGCARADLHELPKQPEAATSRVRAPRLRMGHPRLHLGRRAGLVSLVVPQPCQLGPEFRRPTIRVTHASSEAGPSTDAAPTRRIVLVEDSPDVRETMRDLLEHLGHRVTEARTGIEGFEAILAERPDVALVDVGLPDIDGYEVARRLRATAQGNELFLVALTGHAGAEARARASAVGFDLCLTKPVDLDELERVVRSGRSFPS